MRARRHSLIRRRGAPRCSARNGEEVELFSSWSSSTELLEALVDTVTERVVGPVCDAGVAAMVSGLLEGTGCAVLKGIPPDDRLITVAVTGTWEGASLSGVLTALGSSWASALADAPMLVFRRRSGVELRSLRRFSRPSASAVAFPLLCGGRRVGGVLVAYELQRGFGPSYLAAGKLLAAGLSMRLAGERFEERTRQQGERISRLVCDVERMGNLLRSASPQAPKVPD